VSDFPIFGFREKVTYDNFGFDLLHHHVTHLFSFLFSLSRNIDNKHYNAIYYRVISSQTAELKVQYAYDNSNTRITSHPCHPPHRDDRNEALRGLLSTCNQDFFPSASIYAPVGDMTHRYSALRFCVSWVVI
jgi:hypothetical protein